MINSGSKILAWSASSIAGLYCLSVAWVLHYQIATVLGYLSSLGVELPLTTRLLLYLGNAWTYPILLIATGVFLMVKELTILDKRRTFTITLFTSVLVLLIVNWVQSALLLPLLNLMAKLS